MKILLHDYAGHAFPVELSRTLAERGHEVIHAYATALQTPRGDLTLRPFDPPTLRFQPVEMDPDYTKHKYSFIRRRRMEIAYGRRVAELIAREKPDAVLSGNTPTETQEPIFQACRRQGAKFYFWVQDFYSLAVEKLLRKKLPVIGSAAGRYYRWLERRQMQGSARIVAITEDFAPIMVREFGVNPAKITTIPNWAPIDQVPVRAKRNPWSEKHGLADKFVYLYTGTLGLKHNPALLLELARRHRGQEEVRVVVVSEGLGADWLRRQTAADPLPNLVQMGYQDFADLPDMLAAGDVLTGVLEEDAGIFSVPSKILSYLCAQRPILLAAPAVNLATRIVTGERAGLAVAPDDVPAYLDAAERLRLDPARRDEMAQNARVYAEGHFRIQPIADGFERLLGAKASDGLAAPLAAAQNPSSKNHTDPLMA